MFAVEEVLSSLQVQLTKLTTLTAEEYCADKVKAIYAEFEAEKAAQIAKLQNAIEAVGETLARLTSEKEALEAIQEQPADLV